MRGLPADVPVQDTLEDILIHPMLILRLLTALLQLLEILIILTLHSCVWLIDLSMSSQVWKNAGNLFLLWGVYQQIRVIACMYQCMIREEKSLSHSGARKFRSIVRALSSSSTSLARRKSS